MDVALKAVCKWEMQSGYITVMSGCVFVCVFLPNSQQAERLIHTLSRTEEVKGGRMTVHFLY